MRQILFTIILSISILTLSATQAHAQRSYTLSGYVTDAISGETLLGAAVLLTDESGTRIEKGCVTNSYGFYSLTLPAGHCHITVSYMGYKPVTTEVEILRNKTMNFSLSEMLEIAEAVVTARQDVGILSSVAGSAEIPITQIVKSPALFGETDVLKTIQLMPGVQGGSDGSAGIFVRGGGPDENLIMLDGVPLYGVDHMFGIFSIFTPEAVKKVTLYKGAFPARFGGRLSSIIDVRSNDGNLNSTHGLVNFGMLSSRIHLDGPIKRGTTAYSFSGRMLNTMWMEPAMLLSRWTSGTSGNYYFYDVNAKLSHKLSESDRLFLMFYTGTDTMYAGLDSEKSGLADDPEVEKGHMIIKVPRGNTVVTGRWSHVFSSSLFGNTSLSYNRYGMDVGMEYFDIIKDKENGDSESLVTMGYNSGIRDWDLRSDYEYTTEGGHLAKFGLEYIYHLFRPETSGMRMKFTDEGQSMVDTTLSISSGRNFYGHELSLYAEDEFKLGENLTLNPGVRTALFSTDGKPYFSLEPRLGAKYAFGKGWSVKGSYSRMSQYVHLLSSTSISLPTDLWVPITKDIKPETSDQVSLGAYYAGVPGWEFSFETYYKHADNILEYKDGNMVIFSSSGWQDKVAMGQGRAYGAEFLAQKVSGKATGWIAYTLAKSDRIFPDGSVNNGERFPYKYDRRHNINIVFNYEFSKKVDLSATWSYASGVMTTVPSRKVLVGTTPGNYTEVEYISSRNNFRLPATHLLNLGINFNKTKKRTERTFSLGVYNAYNAMNPNIVLASLQTEYDTGLNTTDSSHPQSVYIELDQVTILPILPYFSWGIKF